MAEMKQFKAESKRLLDLMINSIYTHKEIFLRELISNASDAIDKLYYRSLSENWSNVAQDQLKINISFDEVNRTITIEDNGIGMNVEDMEENLGTIAKSGSLAFKEELAKKEKQDDVDTFIVHCTAGISRSGAVGMFIKDYFGCEIESENSLVPNPLVSAELRKFAWWSDGENN